MENTKYPKIKNAILLCLLLIGIQIVAGLLFGIIIGIFSIGQNSIFYGVGIIIINLVSFGLVIFIGYKKTHKNFNEVFMFKKVPLSIWGSVIIFMFGFVIVSSEIDNILQYFLPMPLFLQNLFEEMLVDNHIIISIILVGIMPSFLEEMLFRGLFLNGFKENYSSKKAIIITAILFGVIHLNPWQFVTAFIIGLISAWVCLKIGSIWLSIYMHLFNNMLAIFALRLIDILPVGGFNTANYEYAFQPLWFDLVGIILTVIGVVLFKISLRKIDATLPFPDNIHQQ